MSTPTPPPDPKEVPVIRTSAEFISLTQLLGVRADWHEPDEQEVDVVVRGTSFDNAGFWPQSSTNRVPSEILERHVIFIKDGKRVGAVNLATLCAWASGYDQ